MNKQFIDFLSNNVDSFNDDKIDYEIYRGPWFWDFPWDNNKNDSDSDLNEYIPTIDFISDDEINL
jgi:hypothetical protein